MTNTTKESIFDETLGLLEAIPTESLYAKNGIGLLLQSKFNLMKQQGRYSEAICFLNQKVKPFYDSYAAQFRESVGDPMNSCKVSATPVRLQSMLTDCYLA